MATKKKTEPEAPKLPVADGDFTFEGRGPIACGEHNSAGQFSTIDEPAVAVGFQSGCDACRAQLDVVLEHAARDTTRI